MSILFDEVHQDFRTHVRKFMDVTSTSARVRTLIDSETGFDAAVWSKMAHELGLQSLIIPEQYGGAGATVVELAIALEEAGRGLHSSPLLASAALATTAILASADDAAMARLLPPMAEGSLIATLAVIEGPGPWSRNVATTASRTADGYTLTGVKATVLDASVADVLLVSARHETGVGLFWTSVPASGITISPLTSLDLTRRYARVAFHDTPATLLGQVSDSGEWIDRIGQVGAILLAAEQAGGAAGVLDAVVDHARSRIQFGSPIGMFQAIKHQCADMLAAVEMAKATAHHAAGVAATVDPDPAELSMASAIAKAFCSEVYLDVATRYIQILGGVGFTWEHDAHLHLRRAKSSEVFMGTPAEHRATVAELLGLSPQTC